MNEKFFNLPLEKQDKIINAAYKVFSQSEYKKAPMSEIANEGNISKALLFHYFVNKKDLYLYLWQSALNETRLASKKYEVLKATEFFEMINKALIAKCYVFQKYPYLYLFSLKAYYEQEPEIKASIHKSYDYENKRSEEIMWTLVDATKFRDGVDAKLLYQQILWTADGYLRQMMSCEALDAVQMEKDF